MEVTFAPRSVLEINDARIIFRNFKGLGDKYNREGDRNFAMIIAGGTLDDGNGKREVTAEEMADALMNDILSHFRSLWILPERQIAHAILRTGVGKFHIQARFLRFFPFFSQCG